MLEIVRGRTWEVQHTVLDYADGPESDLSAFLAPGASSKCEIRERNGTRLGNGDFYLNPVAEPVVTLVADAPQLTLSMSRAETNKLRLGTYDIDVVLTDASGKDWTILPVEPVRVVDRPTQP